MKVYPVVSVDALLSIAYQCIMTEFDEKELVAAAKASANLDVAGWELLFEDLGFKAWRKAEEVLISLNHFVLSINIILILNLLRSFPGVS